MFDFFEPSRKGAVKSAATAAVHIAGASGPLGEAGAASSGVVGATTASNGVPHAVVSESERPRNLLPRIESYSLFLRYAGDIQDT